MSACSRCLSQIFALIYVAFVLSACLFNDYGGVFLFFFHIFVELAESTKAGSTTVFG